MTVIDPEIECDPIKKQQAPQGARLDWRPGTPRSSLKSGVRYLNSISNMVNLDIKIKVLSEYILGFEYRL